MLVRRLWYGLSSLLLVLATCVGLAPKAAALSIQNKTLISASSTGEPGDSHSYGSSFITPDARYILYTSYARNLTNDTLPYPGTAQYTQAYLYDRQQHVTEIVSRNSAGDIVSNSAYPMGLSNDGRYVLFQSDATNLPGYFVNPNMNGGTTFLYLRDRQTGTTVHIGDPSYPDVFSGFMSGDGSTVVYSAITYYNSPYDYNSSFFVYNRTTGITTQFPANEVPMSISDNGRHIAYSYYNSNTGNHFARYDRTDGSSADIAQADGYARLTPDGSHILYGVVGPVGNVSQLYFQDIATGQRKLVFDAIAISGDKYASLWMTPSVSSDGQIVAAHIKSVENNVTIKRLWVANTATGELTKVINSNNGYNNFQAMTPDGTELVYNDYNVYGDNRSDIFEAHIDTSSNQAPTIAVPSSAAVNEGDTLSQPGSITDPDSSVWSGTVDYGDGSGVQPLSISGSTFTLDHVYQDNGNYTVTVSVADNQGLTSTATASVTANNAAPAANAITVSVNPVQVNSPTTASSTFTDPGVLDTHTASWDWGDGTTSAGTVTEAGGNGSVSNSHTYTSPGVYTVALTVTDKDGSIGMQTYQYISVYNPTPQGLFSGANLFTSPAGAVLANPSLTGKAQFGITAKYDTNNQPTGNVSLTFKDASISFNATALSVLVTNNGTATLRGTGSLNGAPGYSLLVTGVSSQSNGNQGLIRFQLKDPSGQVVYDTQPGAPDTAAPATVITGHVLVH